jgi:hypothetical protein
MQLWQLIEGTKDEGIVWSILTVSCLMYHALISSSVPLLIHTLGHIAIIQDSSNLFCGQYLSVDLMRRSNYKFPQRSETPGAALLIYKVP